MVEEDTLRSISVFVGSYLFIILAATLIISLDDFPFSVSFSSALTCISNVGPGLELVGPTGNFSAFSHLSKIVMSLCMIIGRLEIFPILSFSAVKPGDTPDFYKRPGHFLGNGRAFFGYFHPFCHCYLF